MARLRVVTFNVFHDYPRQQHAAERLGLLANTLAEVGADVVLLQEMFVSRELGHWTERLVGLLRARGLAYDSFYAPANGSFEENGIFEEGSAVLSRFPIVERERRLLAERHEVRRSLGDYTFVENRIAVRATVEIAPSVSLEVFSAHVTDTPHEGPGPSARRVQIEDLVSFVTERRRERPAVIGADLNAEPDAADLRPLAEAGFVDPFAGRADVLTSVTEGRELDDPAGFADRRIDYVLLRGGERHGFRIHGAHPVLHAAAEVAPGRHLWASDHHGLLVDCEIAPSGT